MSGFYSKAFFFALGAIWLVCKTSIAQISVVLPTEYITETEVLLTVTVGDVTGQDVRAFLATITFDSSVLRIDSVESENSLSQDFSIVFNTDVPGQITVVGAHSQAMSGEGTLLRLKGTFLKQGATDLVFEEFTFNEGDPAAITGNGSISNTAGVGAEDEIRLPDTFSLAGNYPNPFNLTTTIQFDLPEAAEVDVLIVDMLGRVVMTLPVQSYTAGLNRTIDVDASSLAPGIYVYRVVAEGINQSYSQTATMTLIR